MPTQEQVTLVKGKPFAPASGDILFGAEFISGVAPPYFKAYLLSHWDYNHWEALYNLGIRGSDLSDQVEYECPWRSTPFYWIYPFAISDVPKEALKHMPWVEPCDFSYANFATVGPDKIDQSFFGHGYTSGTLPSDGSIELKVFVIKLSDGRSLYCYGYFWYNK